MPIGLNSPMGMPGMMNRPMGAQSFMNRPMGGQGFQNQPMRPQPIGFNPLASGAPRANPTPRAPAPKPGQPTLADPNWKPTKPPPPGEMRSVLPRSQRPPGSKGWDDWQQDQRNRELQDWMQQRGNQPLNPEQIPPQFQPNFGGGQQWMNNLMAQYGPNVLRGLYG